MSRPVRGGRAAPEARRTPVWLRPGPLLAFLTLLLLGSVTCIATLFPAVPDGRPRTLDGCIDGLRSAKPERVRLAAYGITDLADRLEDPTVQIMRDRLDEIGQKDDGRWHRAKLALAVAVAIARPNAEDVAAQLLSAYKTGRIDRSIAKIALKEMRRPAIDPLVAELVKAETLDDRIVSLAALERATPGNDAAAKFILTCARSPEYGVRLCAASALPYAGLPKDALREELRRLGDDPSRNVASHAAGVLSGVGDK